MKSKRAEQGMILVLVVLLILPLTLMALTIMQSGREQLKMSAASGNRLVAQLNQESTLQQFWQHTDLRDSLYKLSVVSKIKNESIAGYHLSRRYIAPCARTKIVSSSNIIKSCYYLNIDFYGHSNNPFSEFIVAELPLVSKNIPRGDQ